MFNNEDETLYWTCLLCGANLDLDEKCDCGTLPQRVCYTDVRGGDIDEDY